MFTVKFADEPNHAEQFKGTFDVSPGGVLTIYEENLDSRQIYSPGAWIRIEAFDS